jgi:flagellar biosynthesis/type III secretory pathway chaperone
MKRPVDDLVAVLAAQAREYQGLLPILDQEELVLLKADARALAPISELREALVTRLAALERDRGKALRALGLELGLDPRLLTVPRLMQLLPASASALAAVRREISGLLLDLAERNGRNLFLADRTLSWLGGLFTAMAPADGVIPGSAYAPSGRSEQPIQDLRLLDRQA